MSFLRRIKVGLAGHLYADDETVKARLAICRECPSAIENRCNECGSHLDLKAELIGARCRLKKWH